MPRSLLAVFALLVGATSVACGGAASAITAGSEAKPLVAWEGDFVSWFDNSIDPIAVGVSLDGRSPADHPLLGDRTRSADFVGQVTVSTLSEDANGEQVHYHLTVRPAREPLVNRQFPAGSIELFVPETSPAFSIVSGYENLVRKGSFLLFARRFRGAEGPVLRWHLTAPSDDVVKAVQSASTLQVLSE